MPRKPTVKRFFAAIESGDAKIVELLIAQGAPVNGDYWNGPAGSCAIRSGKIHILSLLISHGADPRHSEDALFFDAVYWRKLDALKLLASTVFSPVLWDGKNRLEIEKEADLIYRNVQERIRMNTPDAPDDDEPFRLESFRLARLELFDAAMTCWEHVRPDPPKINISPIPAKGNPV